MEKKWKKYVPEFRRDYRKLLLIMRLAIVLTFVLNLTVSASTYSQNTKLNLEMRNASIEQVLLEIENTSHFIFIYDSKTIDKSVQRNIAVNGQSIEAILNQLFDGTDINYKIDDRQISLYRNEAKPEVSTVRQSNMQQQSVSGIVTDVSGQPLPGVTVLVKGTTNGTITDFNGKYTLTNVPPAASLMFSFVGMKSQEAAIAGKTIVNVQMQEDAIGIEEVVAVGYGVVKKRDVTGSVGSVSAEQLLQAPISSLDAGLQGKIAGVTVQQTTGAPGQNMKIRVRGGSSINYSNEPLYVIDGFIGADISTINPSDIASIDILKDASATAVYGSRGANGVVLITTNSAKAGRLTVSFDGNVGVSSMVNQYDILPAGEVAELMNLQDDAKVKAHSFTNEEVEYFKQNGGTDWVDLVTRQGVRQNYTVNMNGGTEDLKYFFSANHLDEQGVIKESFYKRNSIRSNISGKVSKSIDFTFNTYGTSVSSQNNDRQSNGLNNSIGSAVSYPQFWPARDANGEFIDPGTYPSYNSRYSPGATSSPEMANLQNQETKQEKIISNLDLNFKITSHLSLSVSNSGSFSTGFNGQRDLIDYSKFTRSTIGAQQGYSRGTNYMNTDILTYDNLFGKHALKLQAVYEFQKSVWRSNSAKVASLSTIGNEWHILQNGVPKLTESKYNESKMRSYMGRVNYSYNDKYLMTASLRADGASVFNKNNRWGYFPSAALAWRASEESFVKNMGFIHNLKLRAGVGSTGNTAISPYTTQDRLDNTSVAYIYWASNSVDPVSGIIPGALTDANMTWEKNTQYNVGLDVAVLSGKLSAVIDYYSKQSSDVIIARTIPSYTGQSSFTTNLADISNKGFELALNWSIIEKRDFKWDANFNLAHNKNVVKDLNANQDFIFVSSEEPLGIWIGGTNNKFIVKEGEQMGSFFGLKYLGLWQEDEAVEAAKYGSKPGEPKYEDVNNDSQLSDSDRQIIGTAAPDFTYGLGTNIEYKNFDLAIQCVGSKGNEIYNFSRNILDREILNPDYRNRWSPSNPNASQPIMPVGKEYDRSFVTSQYIENGSYFKISNIALGYNVPKDFARKFNLSSVRLYVSADNVLTITKYSGLDPEGSSTPLTSDSQAGVDAFSYPLVRTFTGGIKVVF